MAAVSELKTNKKKFHESIMYWFLKFDNLSKFNTCGYEGIFGKIFLSHNTTYQHFKECDT